MRTCFSLASPIEFILKMCGRICLQVILCNYLLACSLLRLAEATDECGPNEFKCTNGKCTLIRYVCDGDNDCGDNSDENVCDSFKCHQSAFQCLNGKCITRRWLCNGLDDCHDNSDEKMCGTTGCGPKEFKCANRDCIYINNVCDGDNDCGDNSDEEVCDPFYCHPSAFQCANGKCIPRYRICYDGDDCGDSSDEQICQPFQCHPSAFQCSNGKCISRVWFCRAGDSCGDNSDERYCNKNTNETCPPDWSECANNRSCIPSRWVCDGYPDCTDGSDERNCGKDWSSETYFRNTYNIINAPDASKLKTELRSYLLSRRKSVSRIDRWGSQVQRIAVALHLADNSTFAPGNGTGEEIRHELTMQLLYRLPRNKMSYQELAMYIHALLVSCLDPRDFHGGDLVRELRRRVEATGNFTNPFLILVLCNAGENMTAKDVQRVTMAYNSQQRPFWTDSQALSCMALSCIASRNSGLVDERTLTNMLQELKMRQFRNGTVENLKTTALVTQALFIHDSYKEDFHFYSAIKALIGGLNERKSLLNAYYTLPVLHGKSLLNVSSSHCNKKAAEEEDALKKALDEYGETIIVQYSIWLGDDIELGRTWRLRMLVDSNIYDVIEAVAKIEINQNVQYNVVDGKPYVSALNDEEDDPEMGTFWFIYLKDMKSDESPHIVEQSPVDVKVTPNKEIVLWYKLATWNDQTSFQKQVTSF